MSAKNTVTIRKHALYALLAVLAAGLMFAMMAVPATAHAEKGTPYKYTVRVLAGNQGTVDGGIWETTVEGGGQVVLGNSNPQVLDGSKYVVKGFRESGTDNDDKLYANDSKTYVTVNEDMDFVVSYGMTGNMVPYTIHFVERSSGKKLAEPVTYYGSVGDKPVVSYEYIAGYRPYYRNLTTSEGLKETGNDWTFEYVALAPGENERGTTTTTGGTTAGTTGGTTAGTTGGTAGTTGGTAGTTGGTAGTTGGATGGTAGTTGGASAGAASAGAASAGAASAGATPANPQTEEVLDVDNPLASQAAADKSGESADKSGASSDKSGDSAGKTDTEKKTDGESGGGFPIAAIYAIAAALVAAIAVVLFMLKRRRDAQYDDIFDDKTQ